MADQPWAWRRRQKRLALQSLPADQYPMMIAFAAPCDEPPDLERYYTFGFDLLMSAIRPRRAGPITFPEDSGLR